MKEEPLVRFGVRIRSRLPIETIAFRVNAALGCELKPVDLFSTEESLFETHTLGLKISLSHWAELDSGTYKTYTLAGNPAQGPLNDWTTKINLNTFMLNVLTQNDSHDWYIPSTEELLKG